MKKLLLILVLAVAGAGLAALVARRSSPQSVARQAGDIDLDHPERTVEQIDRTMAAPGGVRP